MEATYAKIRRSAVPVKHLGYRPFYVQTKRETELNRWPCEHDISFSTKQAAEQYAARQSWVVVKRWADAGDEKVSPGREGDGGRSIQGQAACLMPQFGKG
jgi:hypothetical protein